MKPTYKNREEVEIIFSLLEGPMQLKRMMEDYDNREDVVYGTGGWHRYFMRYENRVIDFSTSHCCGGIQGDIHSQNALDLGLRLFPSLEQK